jgi:hypothetical protein
MMHEAPDLMPALAHAQTKVGDEHPDRQAMDIQLRIYGTAWLPSGDA